MDFDECTNDDTRTVQDVKTRFLEVVERSVGMQLDLMDLDLTNFRVNTWEMAERVAIELTRKIAKEELEPVIIKYPLNWIQAIKDRFYPSWLLKKYPVKYRTVVVGADAFYDRLTLPKESHQIEVRIQKYT